MLSEKSVTILRDLASGRTYEQVLARYPAWDYQDIFASFREALGEADLSHAPAIQVVTSTSRAQTRHSAERLRQVKERYPQAYERWTADDDALLLRMVRDRVPISQISNALRRQPGGIRSRISQLGLDRTDPENPPDDEKQPPRFVGRDRYPRSPEPWSPDEDAQLRQLNGVGLSVPRIARRLQRDREIIRIRLRLLGLPFNS